MELFFLRNANSEFENLNIYTLTIHWYLPLQKFQVIWTYLCHFHTWAKCQDGVFSKAVYFRRKLCGKNIIFSAERCLHGTSKFRKATSKSSNSIVYSTGCTVHIVHILFDRTAALFVGVSFRQFWDETPFKLLFILHYQCAHDLIPKNMRFCTESCKLISKQTLYRFPSNVFSKLTSFDLDHKQFCCLCQC